MAGQLRGVAQFLSRARVPESSAGGDAYEAEGEARWDQGLDSR